MKSYRKKFVATKLDYNLSSFKNKDENYFYFLGAALTDGCINHSKKNMPSFRFTILSKDTDWIPILFKISGGSIQTSERLCIYHPDIINALMSDGCVERKSKILQLPKIPSEYFGDFLRGCIDGDGCITFSTSQRKRGDRIYLERTPQLYLCSVSYSFLKDIQDILSSQFGISTKLIIASKAGSSHLIDGDRVITSTVDGYRLICSNRQAFNLLKLLGYDSHRPSMPRKQKIATSIISYYESDNFRKRRNHYSHSTKIKNGFPRPITPS